MATVEHQRVTSRGFNVGLVKRDVSEWQTTLGALHELPEGYDNTCPT